MVMDNDSVLESIWLNDDRERRQRRVLVHEAGHTAVSWLMSGVHDPPPFEHIEVQTMESGQNGLVPGYVSCDPHWFASRSPVERTQIYLGGLYCQNHAIDFTNAEWVEMLDSLEGGDGVDDVAEARIIGDNLGRDWSAFACDVFGELKALEPTLTRLVEQIGSKLVIGQRTYAVEFMPMP